MNKIIKPSETTLPFRIQIGVTGHRALKDKEALSRKIDQALDNSLFELFDEKSRQVIQSVSETPLAFSILTPLAEGADRLVAQKVLERPLSTIEIVLPMNKEDYLQDFPTPESRQEFHEFMAKARRPISLRKKKLAENSAEIEIEDARKQAYDDVGKYVVDHCDVLIALWDGQPSRGKGGTAEIVEYARERNRPLIIISTISPFEITIEKGFGFNAETMIQLDKLNRFAVPAQENDTYINNYYNDLFANPEGRIIPGSVKNLVKEKLLPYYVKASKIAKLNQKLYRHAGFIVHAFSPAAVIVLVLGLFFHNFSFTSFLIEFVLLASILFLVSFSHRKRAHKNWIESRFLAERIRTAIFFAISGVEVSPIKVPPYLGVAHRCNDWMVKAFNEIWNQLPEMKGCSMEKCQQLIDYTRKVWIQDQIKFHEQTYKRLEKLNHRFEIAGIAIFFLAMVAALIHIILSFCDPELHLEGLEHTLTILALTLPAIGAGIGGIRTQREYSRIEKRSKNMANALTDLNRRMSLVTDFKSFEKLLREAEELMLRETQDWLMLMRFTDVEAVA